MNISEAITYIWFAGWRISIFYNCSVATAGNMQVRMRHVHDAHEGSSIGVVSIISVQCVLPSWALTVQVVLVSRTAIGDSFIYRTPLRKFRKRRRSASCLTGGDWSTGRLDANRCWRSICVALAHVSILRESCFLSARFRNLPFLP